MSSLNLRKNNDCLNCGKKVEERYCSHCGQENVELKEDAWHMIMHTITDYFHFENKFFGTLKPLMLKPGELTKQYVAGKRVAFIHPIRLYIFVSIVFFIFAFSTDDKKNKEILSLAKTEKTIKDLDTFKKDSLLSEKLAAVEKSIEYIPNTNGLKDSILKEAKAQILNDTANHTAVNLGSRNNYTWKHKTVTDYEKQQSSLSPEKRDGLIVTYFNKKYIAYNNDEDASKKIREGIMHNIPKMMFILLPFFALFLKLVYFRKNKYYYEHLIYSFHTHSAIFIAILINIFISKISGYIFDISSLLSIICFFYITWYIYRSLRTFYNSNRWITVFKMFILNVCYGIILTLCFLGLIAIGVIIG